MSIELAQGTQLSIAATYATNAYTISAITNASEAVATFDATATLSAQDILEITSGWGPLNYRIARIKSISTSNTALVTLESIDTTSTSRFPVGAGAGTARKVATWSGITQVDAFQAAAPSVEFIDVTTLGDQVRKQIPGLESAPKITGSVLYDPSLAYVNTVLAASDANALTALLMTTPSGKKIYGNAYWKMSRFPQVTIGQAIKNSLDITLASIATVYTS